MRESKHYTGTIRRVHGNGHYGFIECAELGERDIYFHHSRVLGQELFRPGKSVSFVLQADYRGPRAIDVEILDA